MRPPTAPAAFRDTTVPASRTREELTKTLARYGADSFSEQTVRDGERGAYVIRFRRDNRVYRLMIDLGTTPRDERQRMRALYWSLKGMLDAAVFGLLKFEDVLLGYTELPAPGGGTITVGEQIQAQIDAHELPSLTAPVRMLPAPKD